MTNKRFNIENHQIKFGTETMIITDNATGVQYLHFRNGASGGLTPLLNKYGKPIVKK